MQRHRGRIGPVATEPANSTQLKRLPLRANFAWTLAGNVTSAGCAWLIVVAIVKLGSMEMAGQYAFSQAVVVPILGFSMLQLRAICATDAGNEYQFGHYLGLRLFTTLLALAGMAIVAFGTMSGTTVRLLTLAVGFGAAVEAIADAIYGGLQQRERMDYVSISMVCRSTVALAAAVGTLWTTKNIVWSLWAAAPDQGGWCSSRSTCRWGWSFWGRFRRGRGAKLVSPDHPGGADVGRLAAPCLVFASSGSGNAASDPPDKPSALFDRKLARRQATRRVLRAILCGDLRQPRCQCACTSGRAADGTALCESRCAQAITS